MELWVLGLALVLVIGAGLFAKARFDKARSDKEFAGDPVQARLGGHIETYLYSTQDDDAYKALAEGVRGEFEVLGIVSPERTWARLMHAAGLNHEHVKRGLRKKPTPKQTMGAATALTQLSKEL